MKFAWAALPDITFIDIAVKGFHFFQRKVKYKYFLEM